MIAANPKRYVALDSLRGMAAVLVALHHFAALGICRSPLVSNSWLLVDFFFVLSGFIISANYREKLSNGFSIAEFMRLRLARVYPLHAVMLGLWIAGELVIWAFLSGSTTGGRTAFTDKTSVSAIVANLFLVQSIGVGLGQTWNWVAWSISTEVWAYLVFALMARFAGPQLNRYLIGLALLVIALLLVSPQDGAFMTRWMEFGRCLYGFAAGALVHALHVRWPAWGRQVGVAGNGGSKGIDVLEHIMLLGAGAILMFAYLVPVHVVAPIVFAPIVLVFAEDRGIWSRLLALPLPKLLGQISYSIYLIHPFVQLRLMKPLGLGLQKVTGFALFSTASRGDGATIQVWGTSPVSGTVSTVVMLAVVVGLAMLTFRHVEEPARLFIRRRFEPARAPKEATAV